MGVSIKAQISDSTIMMVTIQPNCLNSTPVIPLTSVSGKNTAISVRVDAITDRATSLVPFTAACMGAEPRSMWVVTFSSTTMASSTTIPMAMDNADNETIFSELPVTYR